MMASERWVSAVSWVDGHSRIICGYIRNHHLLDYSAYEMQDFLAEAYLAAHEALLSCDNIPFEACFWNQFKHRCKTLANKPHQSMFINAADIPFPPCESVGCDEKIIEQYLSILTPKQREAFTETKALNISRQALQQRINNAIKAIRIFRQSVKNG